MVVQTGTAKPADDAAAFTLVASTRSSCSSVMRFNCSGWRLGILQLRRRTATCVAYRWLAGVRRRRRGPCAAYVRFRLCNLLRRRFRILLISEIGAPPYGQVVFLPTPPRIGVAARKTPSRIRTEPGQALDGTSCEVQTWTNTNNTVGELSPEELSVAGLLGRTGDT